MEQGRDRAPLTRPQQGQSVDRLALVMKMIITGSPMRRARIAAGILQADLARAIGMGAPRISAYESGALRPSAYTAGIIAKALGASVADLWPGQKLSSFRRKAGAT